MSDLFRAFKDYRRREAIQQMYYDSARDYRVKQSPIFLGSDQMMLTGMLAVNIAGIFTLLTMEPLDHALTVSLIFFCLSLPLLSASLMVHYYNSQYPIHYNPPYRVIVGLLAIILSLTGLAGIFYHFDYWLGMVFICMVWIMMRMVTAFQTGIEIVNKKQEDAGPPAEDDIAKDI